MKTIIPKFIYDEKNKKTGVLFTMRQFEKLIEILEDYEDYKAIKKYGGKNVKKTYPAEEVFEEILGKR